jgi:flagellin
MQIRGTNQAIRNAQDAQAMINTAEGALDEVENIMQRMRELAVQSSNDSNNGLDEANLDTEYRALATELTRIEGSTTYAGQTLLDGSGGNSPFIGLFRTRITRTYLNGPNSSS